MTRRQKREHWAEQGTQAFMMASVCGIGGMLLGVAGLMSGPPLAGVLLRVVVGILVLQCALGVRMIYCIVKSAQVGRHSGREQAVHVEEHSGD